MLTCAPIHDEPYILPPPPLPFTQAAGSKVLGGDASRLRRADELRSDASRLEMSIVAARAEYERIKGVNVEVGGLLVATE